jgi:hypothetical protein
MAIRWWFVWSPSTGLARNGADWADQRGDGFDVPPATILGRRTEPVVKEILV